MGSMRRTETDG